ncbi:MAG: phosphoenolpyruvate carboxylase, partial [Chthoniobacterales bacterium]
NKKRPYLGSGFEKIDRDLTLLIECFSNVLTALGHKGLAKRLPWSPETTAKNDASPALSAQAYSIAFQLLNMVEENAAAYVRKQRESEHGAAAERGLWGFYMKELKASGVKESRVAEMIRSSIVEPVLTAHPTEAKRLSVLEQHRTLFALIEQLNNPQSDVSLNYLKREFRASLERLWRTGEVLIRRTDLSDERRNVLHYLSEVFPGILKQLDDRFEDALTLADYDAKEIIKQGGYPKLRFGTWVGGDRDGHPLVTAEVTADTLASLRKAALSRIWRELSELEAKLTLSAWMQQPPKSLTERFGKPPENYRVEPWRWYVKQMMARVPGNPDAQYCYTQPEELADDLAALSAGLQEIGAGLLVERDVRPVIRVLEIFGFHLASLDIRQNSRFYRHALSELMTFAGLDGKGFMNDWTEEKRVEFLSKELTSPRPFLPAGETAPGPHSSAVLECFRVLAQEIESYGREGIGSLIVSMTTEVSDLLIVYVLARDGGLCSLVKGQLACKLPVVPLFETIPDLQRAPSILKTFLAHPVTKSSLLLQKEKNRSSKRVEQQVMVGYSDSCKDAGIFASAWSLHCAQAALAETANEVGVDVCFFHGRGGTVSRGAGPTHRFLEALPLKSFDGHIRITEQGETIAQKYAHLDTAAYNLELLLAGVTATTLRQKSATGKGIPKAAHSLMDKLSTASENAYRELLNEEGFVEFYREATPLDALEVSQIGSRPARRSGMSSLDDLRAIPWVFSWNQARFYLPGWYGVGTALASLSTTELKELHAWTKSWPFLNYAMTNIESSIASSDPTLMKEYAGLVKNKKLRDRLFQRILDEYTKTRESFDRLYGSPMTERRPRLVKTLKLRADALRKLHLDQIGLLHQWRELKEKGDSSNADALIPEITLSVNAIASGLRTTG